MKGGKTFSDFVRTIPLNGNSSLQKSAAGKNTFPDIDTNWKQENERYFLTKQQECNKYRTISIEKCHEIEQLT